MVRTVISLSEDDKAWLDRTARREGVTMTQLVRQAIAQLRRRWEDDPPTLDELLDSTRGLWSGGDGLEAQKRLRDEWRRPIGQKEAR